MLEPKEFRKPLTTGGIALFLLAISGPVSAQISNSLPRLYAQVSGRVERRYGAPEDMPPPAPPSAPQAKPAAAPQAPAPAAPAATGALPPSMLQQPAQPAEIHFTPDSLSIRAENASLEAILHTLEAQTGMHFEGLGTDERVFGNFGPGDPHEVISDLLNGTPYNVLMVGDQANGAPGKLILTPATHESASAASPPPAAAAEPNPPDEEEQPEPPAPHPSTVTLPRGQMAPGAAQPVKTPQELFEELQAMRRGQAQQNQQPQPPQQ